MEKIREGLPQLALGEVGFDDQNRGPGGASGEGLQVMLVGDSAQVLAELSDSVVETLSKLPGARDVYADLGTKSREVQILVDRDRALQYGFSTQQIASYVSIALRGTPLREFRSAAGEVPVWLRFAESDDASVDDLRDLKLRAADGSMIPLMSMISLKVQAGASTITRQNRQTALPIKINLVDGVSMEQARKDLEAAMASIQLPAGYRLSLGGVFDDADDAMAQMGFNTLIALLMVMVIMAAVFESLLFPLVIVTGFGFSIFGVYWLFWLTGTTFSLMAMIGILVLMGVVVNNGIVMVEHVNELRRNGMARDLALVQGCRDRLRPILMTMGTAILGMLPLCVGGTQIGGDGPPYFPMARAIVGGLVFSTAVSLLVLPVLYSLMDRMRLRTTQRWRDALDRVKLRSPQST